MSYNTQNALIAPTRDTHENWTKYNPVLPKGVLGITTGRTAADSVELFLGNGVDAYDDIPKSGATGATGAAAGWGVVSASVQTLEPEQQATVSVEATGDNTAKNIAFSFGIPKGAQGDKGEQGDPGAQGPQGIQGATGEKGEKGDKGDPGENGTDGAAATITVGSVTTGDPGTEAKVENVGTTAAAILNFTIPAGAKGETGEQGPAGTPGAAGEAGPAGAAGEKGDPGESAGFGEPTASASSLESTQAPTVSVQASGPDTAKIFTFAFGIPKGEKGDKGDKGDTGEQGPAGAAGEQGPQGPAGAAGTNGTNAVFQILTAVPEASALNEGEVAFVVGV